MQVFKSDVTEKVQLNANRPAKIKDSKISLNEDCLFKYNWTMRRNFVKYKSCETKLVNT